MCEAEKRLPVIDASKGRLMCEGTLPPEIKTAKLLASVSGHPPSRLTTIEIYRTEKGELGAVVKQRFGQDEDDTICQVVLADEPISLYCRLIG